MGMILTVWRILRCNPFCPGGYDPVPQHGFPTRGYYSIPGNEITPDDDTTEQLAPHDTDAPAQPKLICEDYVLRRSHKAPVKKQPPQHRAE